LSAPVLTSGLLTEVMAQGLAYIYLQGLVDAQLEEKEVNERVADVLKRKAEELSGEDITSSAVMGHFKDHYFSPDDGVLVKWYGGGEQPTEYARLMLYVMEGTARLLRQGQVSFLRSLGSVEGLSFGEPFRGKLAIVPAILKQAEFYERQTVFMSPTKGPEADLLVDPVWFAILALGFMLGFGGYYDGAYHVFTKPGLPITLEGLSSLHTPTLSGMLEGLELVSKLSRDVRPSPASEEVFSIQMAMGVAESGRSVSPEAFPLNLYVVEFVANTYTVTRSLSVDLEPLVAYLNSYLSELRKLTLEVVREEPFEPLKVIVGHAVDELAGRGVSGEPVFYLFVKDFYRAVVSRNATLLEDALLRFLRRLDVAIRNRELRAEAAQRLMAFRSEQNVQAMLKAIA